MELKYSEILQRNAELSRNLPGDKFEIAVLSNVTVFQAKEILEYALRVENIPAAVTVGDYDNIVQDSLKYQDADLVIVFGSCAISSTACSSRSRSSMTRRWVRYLIERRRK